MMLSGPLEAGTREFSAQAGGLMPRKTGMTTCLSKTSGRDVAGGEADPLFGQCDLFDHFDRGRLRDRSLDAARGERKARTRTQCHGKRLASENSPVGCDYVNSAPNTLEDNDIPHLINGFFNFKRAVAISLSGHRLAEALTQLAKQGRGWEGIPQVIGQKRHHLGAGL